MTASTYTTHALAKAGFWQRMAALSIDELVLIAITYVCLLILGRLLPATWYQHWWFRICLYEVFDYNYYTLCWYFGGQTVGKRCLRAKVVKLDQSALTYWDVVVRYWVWMFGIALVGIGYLWISWDSQKRGWNDHAAGTVVIRCSNSSV